MLTDANPTDAGSQMYSRFGGLWIDRRDSEKLLAERIAAGRINSALGEKIAAFMRDGYIVLKAAVPKSETKAIRDELDSFWANPPDDARVETYEVPNSTGVKLVKPHADYRQGTTKLLDFQAWSPRLRNAIANPQAVEFLSAIFEMKPKAFQGLTFWRGSKQSIHKDTAYVQVDGAPMHIAASWLALEDVRQGAGELVYFKGSHRAPDFLFGGHSKWHADAPHEDPLFLQSHLDDAKKYNFEKSAFLGEEGDMLIWHADLAHGGGEITIPGASRQSHVTHFTSEEHNPPYAKHVQRQPYEQNGMIFLSGHKQIA